jgi:Ankyrin repeats (3 copies)/IPT/TIG domain
MQQLYSAPASAHQSRAPSPNGLRNSAQNYQQAQIAQAVANTLYGMPLSLNPHRLPTIHKMIPSEGPKSGGIEVTCLGSGFCQGLEVMFGDIKATTTTYWGETSLVCLLPPAAFAGTVPVTFKHQHQQQQIQPYPTPPIPKQQIFFKYVDDDEQQLIRTALSVLGHKMTGKAEDVRELARRIIGDGSSSWGASTGHSPSGVGQHQQVSGLNASAYDIDVEATLLRCLDLIDLDDSPNMPRLNLRRASGQTMLHLACALGLHRFVAALLARGVNPEPRDNGGFTPMHFAAMHNHPQIVRRLILCGADPTMRSLQGYTPSDLATSDEVLRSTRRIERHIRTHSGGSMRSRTSSATSLRSLWEQPSYPWSSVKSTNAENLKRSLPSYMKQGSSASSDDEYEYDAENTDAGGDDTFWMRSSSRRTSGQIPPLDDQARSIELPAVGGGLSSPTAAVAAFRDQLSAQIHHLQQTMQLNLPNLPQMPTLPMIPNLPDYQAYLPTAPMVRRISSLVPHMGASRPGTADHSTKDTDYRWWDLFSGTIPPAPPAYDDIFPRNDLDVKRSSVTQAAADALADNKCAALFDQLVEATGSSTGPKSALLEALRIGQRHPMIREQQEQLRLAHAEKVKRLRSDRNLFFIWVCTFLISHFYSDYKQIPLLIVIMLAMLYNRVPAVISGAQQLRALAVRNNDYAIGV